MGTGTIFSFSVWFFWNFAFHPPANWNRLCVRIVNKEYLNDIARVLQVGLQSIISGVTHARANCTAPDHIWLVFKVRSVAHSIDSTGENASVWVYHWKCIYSSRTYRTINEFKLCSHKLRIIIIYAKYFALVRQTSLSVERWKICCKQKHFR